ncbi:hypothetical protein [Candidatus Tremblaya princeps]|uniref:hypothetical protein n=1 Tax=Tremblaya princeps TaxID=189385 RepID=UPI0009462E09|nr:hypothetical protein [Candidatus Tremblaya princeps]
MGHDYLGTAASIRASRHMLSLRQPANYPAYILHKMVRLVRNGAAVKMAKRLGTTLPHTALLKGTAIAGLARA